MSALVVRARRVLVVASNVATLVFARTWSRAPELAVRTALGAARGASWASSSPKLDARVDGRRDWTGAARRVLRYLERLIERMPFWVYASTRACGSMAFVVVADAAGQRGERPVPALRVTRHDLRNTLQAGRGFAFGGFGRAGAALLIVEIALSVALLNGAVTMARSFEAMLDEVPALPKGQVLTAQMGRIDSPRCATRWSRAAAAMPGVVAAGAGHAAEAVSAAAPTAVEADRRRAAAPRLAPTVRSARVLSKRSARAPSPAACSRRPISSKAPLPSPSSTSRLCRSSSAAATRSAAGSASRRRGRPARQPGARSSVWFPISA